MGELKQAIESILFSAGRKVSVQEIQKLTKAKDSADVQEAVEELKADLNARGSSLMVVDEGDGWKITVKESYLPTVQTINPHTELSKSILETLAIIAWKQPIVQSDVIKVRTNKAYDHISELMKLGFISKQRFGRSYAIKVTQKFKDYFDLPDDKAVKELFKGFKDVEVAVKKKAVEFEKVISEEDKELLESRTPEETDSIAAQAVEEELGMESFSDELPPVEFPDDDEHLKVYTDNSVKKRPEDALTSVTDNDDASEDEDAGDEVSDDKPLDKKQSSAHTDESPEEKAKRLAAELLKEDEPEPEKEPTRTLHPILEEVLAKEHNPKEDSEVEGKSKEDKEDSPSTEKPEADTETSDDDKDSKDIPAESFPGEFSGASDDAKKDPDAPEEDSADEKK